MKQETDTLFSKPQQNTPFQFDKKVAQVFPDMIKRSVPGYPEIIHGLTKIAKRSVTAGSHCYDLGCSLGEASLAVSHGISVENTKIIAVDNSLAMLERCHQYLETFKNKVPIKLIHADLADITIENASMVILNFTLQFIVKEQRQNILEKIYDGMNSGGVLVLSEKLNFEDSSIQSLITELHHEFKMDNGYSELEISQKRMALEKVLIPESMQQHLTRLKNAGFSHVDCWLQHYNFASILAIK